MGRLHSLPPEAGRLLLALARGAIARALELKLAKREQAPWLREHGACFVTLTENGALRGCIGSLDAYRALGVDVEANAAAAALHDTRFEPLRADQLDRVNIEVSLLSALERVPFESKADALARLRPGIDGVVIELGKERGTFLPQVWSYFSDPADFITNLCRKTGLTDNAWRQGINIYRYTVVKWIETPEEVSS